MRRAAFGFFLLVGLAVAPASAHPASIGIVLDADCATCSGTTYPGLAYTLHLVANFADPFPGDLAGAEFSVAGLPAGWIVTCVPNPAAFAFIGDPFGFGCNIAFAPCIARRDCFPLYTCTIIPTTWATDVRLWVNHHLNPGCPGFCCTTFVLCDPPVYTKMCVRGGVAILNGAPCTVGVQPSSWTRVKSLYDE